MIKCFLDCETTGVDPYKDRIVEIMLMREDDEGDDCDAFSTLVNPGVPIPPGATVVHGISDEDVKDSPTFVQIGEEVQRMLEDAVLIGYNSRDFDVPLIQTELRRNGFEGLPLDEYGAISVPEIDLFRVWKVSEKRDLATASRRFAGIHHEDDAHRATADVEVLAHVLAGMRGEFDLDGYDDMVLATTPADEVDRDGKFKKNAEGKIVFNFGKHGPKGGEPGKPVSRNMGYIEWMLEQEFSPETQAWCRRFIEWSRT